MHRLICLMALGLAACSAPEGEDPSGSLKSPGAVKSLPAGATDARPYAGEWASDLAACRDERKIWTIESHRLGMRRERFCVFGHVRVSRSSGGDEAWRADARCVAGGQQSEDVLFFRIRESGQAMRVTVNDADAVDLVRCPMRA